MWQHEEINAAWLFVTLIVPTAAGQEGGGGPAGLEQGCCAQKNIHFGFLPASGVIEFYRSLQQWVICGF